MVLSYGSLGFCSTTPGSHATVCWRAAETDCADQKYLCGYHDGKSSIDKLDSAVITWAGAVVQLKGENQRSSSFLAAWVLEQ